MVSVSNYYIDTELRAWIGNYTHAQLGGCGHSRFSCEIQSAVPGVHNAKAEECTTPYMRQNIEINIGVGGLHGNQGY